jgi:thiamine biosynthesis protein ThiS
MGITFLLNGKETISKEARSIGRLLSEHGINPDHVVVEINQEIIRREKYEGSRIKEGDRIEILRFVGGG